MTMPRWSKGLRERMEWPLRPQDVTKGVWTLTYRLPDGEMMVETLSHLLLYLKDRHPDEDPTEFIAEWLADPANTDLLRHMPRQLHDELIDLGFPLPPLATHTPRPLVEP